MIMVVISMLREQASEQPHHRQGSRAPSDRALVLTVASNPSVGSIEKMKECCPPLMLSLDDNAIGDDGATAIADALVKNTRLTEIEFALYPQPASTF